MIWSFRRDRGGHLTDVICHYQLHTFLFSIVMNIELFTFEYKQTPIIRKPFERKIHNNWNQQITEKDNQNKQKNR